MKYKRLYLSLLICLMSYCSLYGQNTNQAGQLMFSAGAGLSNLKTSFIFPKQSNIPEFNGTIDYFILRWFSIGVSASYQTVEASNYFNWYFPDGTTFNGNLSESLSRFNISARPTVYITKFNNPLLYGGLRIGYEFFRDMYTPFNPGNPTGNPKYAEFPDGLTWQVYIGARAYLTKFLSAYLEVGTGIPYYAELGLSYSLNLKSNKSDKK
jgi:hypothetical protein